MKTSSRFSNKKAYSNAAFETSGFVLFVVRFIYSLALIFVGFILVLNLLYGLKPDYTAELAQGTSFIVSRSPFLIILLTTAFVIICLGLFFLHHFVSARLHPEARSIVNILSIIMLLILVGGIGFLFIRRDPLYPFVDQQAVWEMGYHIVHPDGDIPWTYSPGYWDKWPFQKEMAFFMAFVIKVTHAELDDYRYYQYLSLLFDLILILSVYCLSVYCGSERKSRYSKKSGDDSAEVIHTSHLSRERFSGWLGAVIMGFFIPLTIYTAFVYPTIISLAFTMLAFAIFEIGGIRFYEYKSRRSWVVTLLLFLIGSCFLVVSNLIYSATAIASITAGITVFLVAIQIVCSWARATHSVNTKPTENVKIHLLFSFFVIILSILVVLAGNAAGREFADEYFQRHFGIEKSAGVPVSLKVAMGISSDSMNSVSGPGGFDDNYLKVFNASGYDSVKTDAYYKNELKGLLKEYATGKRSLSFFLDKSIWQWCDPWFDSLLMAATGTPTYSDSASADHFIEQLCSKPVRMAEPILIAAECGIYFLAFAGLIMAIRRADASLFLPTIYFVGGFAFQLLWETKSRYCLPYFIALIPVAMYGLSGLTDLLQQRRRKRTSLIRYS